MLARIRVMRVKLVRIELVAVAITLAYELLIRSVPDIIRECYWVLRV
jgi:hypothetical protein